MKNPRVRASDKLRYPLQNRAWGGRMFLGYGKDPNEGERHIIKNKVRLTALQSDHKVKG